MRVVERAWDTPSDERKMVEDEIGRLVSQGIRPGRIVILSPNTKRNTVFDRVEKIKEWPLMDYKDAKGNCIRFATIRSFKGLEADIVFLIGLREGNHAVTESDIYVGGSRARFLLYVFYSREGKPRGIRTPVSDGP